MHQTLVFPKAITALLLALALLTATGCGSRKADQATTNATPNAPIEQRGNWFCQPAVPGSADPWECVQDAALANNPKPDRLPDAQSGPSAEIFDDPEISPIDSGGNDSGGIDPDGIDPERNDPDAIGPVPIESGEGDSDETDTSRQPADPDPPELGKLDPTPPQARARPISAARLSKQTTPRYAQLAYQPPKPVSMLDLPKEFYALQVAALPSADALESFVTEHQLVGISAAKVVADNSAHYVLLLGIYETRALAQQASEHMPSSLDSATPWIRPLANLQQAMQQVSFR